MKTTNNTLDVNSSHKEINPDCFIDNAAEKDFYQIQYLIWTSENCIFEGTFNKEKMLNVIKNNHDIDDIVLEIKLASGAIQYYCGRNPINSYIMKKGI